MQEHPTSDSNQTEQPKQTTFLPSRPAVEHHFNDDNVNNAHTLSRMDEIEILTLNPATSTFTVEPLTSASSPSLASTTAGSSDVPRFYKRCSNLGLSSSTASSSSSTLALSSILDVSDLKPAVYEGGFKVWECAIDLILYLQQQIKLSSTPSSASSSIFPFGLSNLRVCELGCGHAFPSLYLIHQGAQHVTMQDYNSEVIIDATIPNAKLNLAPPTIVEGESSEASSTSMDDSNPSAGSSRLIFPTLSPFISSRCRFFSGDWRDSALLSSMGGPRSMDLILTSDTLYSTEYFVALFDLITSLLNPSTGCALIAAKRYYFGIGGSTLEFCELVQKRGKGEWKTEVVKTIEDGKSNIREIILLKHK